MSIIIELVLLSCNAESNPEEFDSFNRILEAHGLPIYNYPFAEEPLKQLRKVSRKLYGNSNESPKRIKKLVKTHENISTDYEMSRFFAGPELRELACTLSLNPDWRMDGNSSSVPSLEQVCPGSEKRQSSKLDSTSRCDLHAYSAIIGWRFAYFHFLPIDFMGKSLEGGIASTFDLKRCLIKMATALRLNFKNSYPDEILYSSQAFFEEHIDSYSYPNDFPVETVIMLYRLSLLSIKHHLVIESTG